MVKKKRRRRRKKKNTVKVSPYLALVIVVSVFILGAITFFLVNRYVNKRLEVPEKPAIVKKAPPPPVVPQAPVYKYKVAIVIDDMGRNLAQLRELLKIKGPINIAVLPYLRASKKVAGEAHKRGWNVLLHLPMEPTNSKVNNPGKGALLTAMSRDALRRVFASDMQAVPYITGVNNHMGSKFTEQATGMRTVLKMIKDEGLFFLDSRTSSKSVGFKLARSMGVRTATRNVFLDNKQDKKYIRGQIEKLMRRAIKNGTAIAIGHPHKETISVLLEMADDFAKNGIALVKLDELVK